MGPEPLRPLAEPRPTPARLALEKASANTGPAHVPTKPPLVPCLCRAQVSLLSVDDMYQNLPPAVKDKYWNESTAQPPYTTATAAETLKPSFLGSTFDMR